MRRQRDIGQVLDAWLAPGPTEMPDRLFDDVLERIEHVPQRRVAWTARRLTTMFATLKLPAAAVSAALVIGLLVSPLWTRQVEVAAPAASVSAAPSVGVPDALIATWAAEPRSVDGLGLSDRVARFDINRSGTDVTFFVTDLAYGLWSTVTATAPDRFTLTSHPASEGCAADAVGTYAWQLSDDGLRAMIRSVGDECAARAAFLEGTWARMGCHILATSCMGEIAPGRHETGIFDPWTEAPDAGVARPGSLTYTLPDGWANSEDWLSTARFMPADDYRARMVFTGAPVDQLSVLARPVAAIVAAPACEFHQAPAVGGSVDSLVAWLAGHPDLVTSEPAPITVDGRDGLVMDVDLAPTISEPCREAMGGAPGVPLFADASGIDENGMYVPDSTVGTWESWVGYTCPACTSDPKRLILLDLDGQPLLIILDSAEPADQDAFVEEAMPIVDSFEFPT